MMLAAVASDVPHLPIKDFAFLRDARPGPAEFRVARAR
jgi:hypothetical protein